MKRAPLILGAADGVIIALGLVVIFLGHPDVFRAARGAGLSELVGMTAGVWLSDGPSGFWPALGCGVAACAACIAPAVPYLLWPSGVATVVALLVVAVLGGVIAWLRPEKGALALVQTFGVLVAAAALCVATG